jgi:hypothetical protein
MKSFLLIFSVIFSLQAIGQNVGIGTSNPLSKLDVRGNVSINDNRILLRNGSDQNHWLGWIGGVVDGAKIVGNSGVVINNSAFDQDVAFFKGDYAYFGFNPGSCCIGFEAAKLGKGRNNDGTLEFMNNGWGRVGGSNGLAFWANGGADTDDNPHMVISQSGYVGIGNNSPSNGRLHVSGVANGGTYAYGWLNPSGNTGSCGSCFSDYSIWADGRIRASEFNAMSDIRIKSVVGITATSDLLSTINKLKVTNYSYIDVFEHGNKSKEGFIAQEVEKVIPTAVSKSADFIPNIFTMAEKYDFNIFSNIITVKLKDASFIKKGDLVKIISDETTNEVIILDIVDNTSISFKLEKMPKSLFVYGTKVNDFRTVDYDQLFSIGIGAIQELSKQNEELKSQLSTVNKRINELEQLNESVKNLESYFSQISQND